MRIVRGLLLVALMSTVAPVAARENAFLRLTRCAIVETDAVEIVVCRTANWNLAQGADVKADSYACVRVGSEGRFVAGGCADMAPDALVDGGAAAMFDVTVPARSYKTGATGTLTARGTLLPGASLPWHYHTTDASGGAVTDPSGGASFLTNTNAPAQTLAVTVSSTIPGVDGSAVPDGTVASLYTGSGGQAGSYPY